MFYTLLLTLTMFLITIILFFMQSQPSILIMLFILEAATLSALIILFLYLWSTISLNPYLLFIFITFSACGASLGLAMLVANVRFWGSDMFKTSTTNSC
nr:NADH dehydrogenase subunit 4L [Cirriformia sp.]